MSTIVLISGKMRSGKDTIANIISERLKSSGVCPVIMHFSDSLKEILSKTLGMSLETLNFLKNNPDYKIEQLVQSPNTVGYYYHNSNTMRNMLQKFGTDAMQSILGKDVWVNALKKKIENDTEHNVFIIPDFRFKHEFINDYKNFKTISIKVLSNTFDSSLNSKHISEHDLDNFVFDYTINNPKQITGVTDGVYADCANVVNEILKEL